MNLQNLHTHTNFCDGANTAEEMVLSAIEKGFDSVGFSGHAYMSYSLYFQNYGDKTEAYREEVKRLKEVYKDRIEIYLGIEADMFADSDMTGFDYLIGSVHYLRFGDKYATFDVGEAGTESFINEYFGGDGLAYAKEYYRTLAQMPDYGKFDIIGHFDLITKHCENRDFFDITSKEYLNAAFEAAEALSGKIPFFEVNTGAISRGYRTSPYPTVPIMKELKRLGFGAVITSDCHNKETIDCAFDLAAELLKECGFEEKYILTGSGFKAVAL